MGKNCKNKNTMSLGTRLALASAMLLALLLAGAVSLRGIPDTKWFLLSSFGFGMILSGATAAEIVALLSRTKK